MLLIRPTRLLPSMITSSSAGAADAEYDAGKSYALGARVFLSLTAQSYECIQGPALDKNPMTEPLYWIKAAPSNRWALFDADAGTATATPGDLTLTLEIPARFNAMALFGLVGSAIRVVQRSATGAQLKVISRALRTEPADWYEYFFGEQEQVSDVYLPGFVPSSGSKLEITITGPAACAAAVVGSTFDLGDARWGVQTGISDYTTNAAASANEPGKFSRRMSVMLEQPAARYPVVTRVLESLRGMPFVCVGVPGYDMYSPMLIYGKYRDFSIEVSTPTTNICSMEIESLTK